MKIEVHFVSSSFFLSQKIVGTDYINLSIVMEETKLNSYLECHVAFFCTAVYTDAAARWATSRHSQFKLFDNVMAITKRDVLRMFDGGLPSKGICIYG